MDLLKRVKGQIGATAIVGLAAAVCVITVIVVNVLPLTDAGSCITRLEGQGYAVFAAGEYASLDAKVDALKVSADAAVVNAEAAVLAAQDILNTLLLHTENEVFLYPDTASATCTLTAGAGVDTWSAWTELVDNGAVTLSSKFVADSGYLHQAMTHDYSIADKIFIIEIAYDNDGTDIVGRIKVRSDWTYVSDLNSVVIPAGETIYYRMQSETAGATLQADFRYYFD